MQIKIPGKQKQEPTEPTQEEAGPCVANSDVYKQNTHLINSMKQNINVIKVIRTETDQDLY